MKNFAEVVGWKLGHPQGLRTFGTRAMALQLAGNAPLLKVGEIFVLWPDDLGPAPDARTLATWEQEYEARAVERPLTERVAELESKVQALDAAGKLPGIKPGQP